MVEGRQEREREKRKRGEPAAGRPAGAARRLTQLSEMNSFKCAYIAASHVSNYRSSLSRRASARPATSRLWLDKSAIESRPKVRQPPGIGQKERERAKHGRAGQGRLR